MRGLHSQWSADAIAGRATINYPPPSVGARGDSVRLSDLARTTAVGLALGGAAYAPLGLLDARAAGAITTNFNIPHVVFTINPELYIREYGAWCYPVENPVAVCIYLTPRYASSAPTTTYTD